jgi:alanine-synthesizing transaminase
MEDANVTEAAEKPCRCAWRIAEVGPNPLNYNFLAAWRRPRSSAVSGAVTSCAEHTGAANRLPASVFAPLFVRISSGSRLFAGVLPAHRRNPRGRHPVEKAADPRLTVVAGRAAPDVPYRRTCPARRRRLRLFAPRLINQDEVPAVKPILKSNKLLNVCYDIRGPVLEHAKRLEEEGHRIIKLNIGNLAPFGFEAPDEIIQDMILNLPGSSGYSDSKGVFAARKAIMHYTQQKGVHGVELDDIYIGNGASELIVMALQGLLNDGDEVLLPAPDYPLWTAGVSLSGGTPVHYICDESNGWMPDLDDIRAKITPNTRALVVINPNNPTGALYSDELLLGLIEIARQHGLVIFADEVYDKIVYDGKVHTSVAALSEDVLTVTFNSLSKSYRSCGYRAGWMFISGLTGENRRHAKDYFEGLGILASMRLCPNVPGQYAIQTALGGYQSINDLIVPSGRLYKQRQLAYDMLTAIPGVSCVKPEAALYMFPRLDPKIYPIQDDQQFILDLLLEERVLLVQGTGFNWKTPDHFRVVFLPNVDDLADSINRIARFLDGYRKRHTA